MADEILARDQNTITVLAGVTDDSNQDITMLRVDPSSKRLLVSAASEAGGTVTSVSVVTANGISGSVATATTTPAITLDISALNATKIADGSVSNTEFQYLNGVTGAIQTQIDAKMTNPMTTAGDVIYGGASGAPTRLANGTAGQVLTSNGTTLAPSWQDAGGAGVLTATRTLTQSEVNNLHTTPITLLAAQGANTVIQVTSAFFYYDYGTSAFAGGGYVNIRYNNANDDMYTFTDYTGTADYMVWGHSSGYNRPLSYGENLPLTLGNPGAAITGGTDSTITCTISYIVIST